MKKNSLPKPVRVIREKVPPEEVGKYYLKAEFHRLFHFSEPGALEEMGGFIDRLEGKIFWRVLEAMSFAHRINGVFRFVSDTARTWSEEEYSIGDLRLTGMNPSIDKITYSPEINQDPLKFRDHLLKYFKEYPHDDPEGLDFFRPKGKEIRYPKILLRQEEKGLLMLDGINRLVVPLLRGKKTIVAFVGKVTNPEGKPMVGDSVFVSELLARTGGEINANTLRASVAGLEDLGTVSPFWGNGFISDLFTNTISSRSGISVNFQDDVDFFTNLLILTERTAPGLAAANTCRIFAEEDPITLKTRLMVRFQSGISQQIAIEP